MAPTVDILLATFNGEAFLAEQIESVLAQSFTDWRLLVRDDGSSDESTTIVEHYVSQYPGRILLIADQDTGLGAAGNFARLMEHSQAPYVMLCDQDDVWLPGKISILMEAMDRLEEVCGRDLPLLVHSDLTVVGRDLEPLNQSFWAYQAIDPTFGRSVNRLLIQNVVTGCASLCNRKLIEFALPIPADAMMHDWWMALVAASFGRIAYVREATVRYRQHSGNTLGAKRFDLWAMLLRGIKSPRRAYRRARLIIGATERQARAFLQTYGDHLSDHVRDPVSRFATLSAQGGVERRLTILRYRFLTNGLLSRLILLVAV